MDNTEFSKLTKGSIVGFVAYPQFTGTVLATYVDTPETVNLVVVDLPPNSLTNNIDPKPQAIKAEYLNVVKYADGGEADAGIPQAIKVAVSHWTATVSGLMKDMESIKNIWGF